MDFSARPPSTMWEAVTIPANPPGLLWVWFKPPSAPSDVLIQIPPETQAACGAISMRRALQLVGLPVEQAQLWSVQGATFPVQAGANPLLDQPLPSPGPWGDPGVSVRMLAVGGTAVPIAPMTTVPAAAPNPEFTANATSAIVPARGDVTSEHAMEAFAADWQALLALETQLSSSRKQLGAVQGQLQSLNRDLSPDERLVADNQDKKDWQDARRWLRDSLATVSRWIRDHDIGMVSAAGNRNRFEQVYEQHIVPRTPCAGLATVCQEFEQHRKTAQNLLVQMQSAHQNASRDGVNRARQVLNRISAKVRRSKEKRGTR